MVFKAIKVKERIKVKIRSVFILFNGVVVFLLLVIGSALLMMKSDLSILLPGIVVPGIVLLVLDGYYALNHRLLFLLEKDDWPALVQYLETKMFRDGRYTAQSVRLLAQAYLLLSDAPAVVALENKTGIAKPALVEKHALLFGVARVLEKDQSGAVNFFYARLHTAKPNKADLLWVRFYYGFALLLSWRYVEAADEFIIVTKIADDAVLTGLSAWFLADTFSKALPERRADILGAAEAGREKARAAVYDIQEWDQKVLKRQREAHVTLLAQYLQEAGKWVFDVANVERGDWGVETPQRGMRGGAPQKW